MRKRSVGIILQYASILLNMFCGLFLSAFLLRSLGSTEYGLYQTISSFVNNLVLLEFGTGTVITRNIAVCRNHADKEGIQKNISTIWGMTSILVGVIVIVGTIFYCSLGRIYSATLTQAQIQYGRKMFLVILAFLIASFYSNTLNGILLGFERYEIQPIITLLKLIFRTLTLVVLVLVIRKSIVIAIVDLALCLIIDTILIIYCVTQFNISFQLSAFDRGVFVSSLPLAAALFIQVLVNQANSNVDKFVIGIKLGPEVVAVYSIGLFIYSVFSSLTTIPIMMYAPQIIKEISSGYAPDEVSRHMIQPSRYIVLIGGSILFGFFAVGKQFITIVYGASYVVAWKVALIIMAPMLINMSNGVMINILDAIDKRIVRSNILLITTIANIVLTVLWIEKYGMVGACVATAVCTLLGQILLMDIYYYKNLAIDIFSFKKGTFKGIVIWQAVASVAAYTLAKLIPNTVISLLAGGLIYLAVFVLFYFSFGASETEKKIAQLVRNRLIKRMIK